MNILITGGSGFIGRRLTAILKSRGHQVSWLVRNPAVAPEKAYRWSVKDHYVDPEALREAEVLIHLAGENVAEKRWTKSRKKEILESRTEGTRLLVNHLSKYPNKIKTVVCASASGYYGNGGPDDLFTEHSRPGNDFLAEVTKKWEDEAVGFESAGIRLVTLRIGVVLSLDGGALPKLILPVKMFAGAPLGTGKQYMSWIHIDDLCNMFIKAAEDQTMTGIYNAVAPQPVDNKTMTRLIARRLHRPLFFPAVPASVLHLVLGEMAIIVTGGAKLSSEKIEQKGFHFDFPDPESALKNILG
ncbi:MAG: TIGR01777 family oxidoreductase [Cyclobacteriaceae bacterium]